MHYVWVAPFFHELAHDLQFAVFEPLVLEHFLDRHHVSSALDSRLEDHAKGSISNNALCVVADGLPGVAAGYPPAGGEGGEEDNRPERRSSARRGNGTGKKVSAFRHVNRDHVLNFHCEAYSGHIHHYSKTNLALLLLVLALADFELSCFASASASASIAGEVSAPRLRPRPALCGARFRESSTTRNS